MLLLSLFLIALSLILTDGVSGLCYTPDGTISNDVPCNASASVSVCCTQGFLCTSTQLCQPADWWSGASGNPLQFIRGTCTDKTWAAAECPGHCVADNPSGGEWVMRCGNNTDSYCCSADNCCSDPTVNRVTLDPLLVTATAGIAVTTTTASSMSSSTSTSSGTSARSASSSSTAATTDSSGDTDSNNKAIPVGVGVGVGVGVVVIAGLVGFILFRKRRKRRAASKQPIQEIMGSESKGYSREQQPPPPWELDSRHPRALAELDTRSR